MAARGQGQGEELRELRVPLNSEQGEEGGERVTERARSFFGTSVDFAYR